MKIIKRENNEGNIKIIQKCGVYIQEGDKIKIIDSFDNDVLFIDKIIKSNELNFELKTSKKKLKLLKEFFKDLEEELKEEKNKKEDLDVTEKLQNFLNNNNLTEESKEKIEDLYLTILRWSDCYNMNTVNFLLEDNTALISIDITKFNTKTIGCEVYFNE